MITSGGSASLFALLAVALSVACAAPAPPPDGNHNLLLITLDTVRADFLEPYGYPDRSSPNLQVFAEEALVFEQAYSTAPRTGPSHASILTSRNASDHGVLFNGKDLPGEIASDCTTLSEHLARAGLFSGAVVSVSILGEKYGFHRGFDTFEHERSRRDSQKPEAGGGADNVTDTAVSWLKTHRGRRLFLWVHYYEVHAPFHCEPRTFDEMGIEPCELVTMESARAGAHTAEAIRQSYRAEVFELDRYVGNLLRSLEELNLTRSTVVAVVGDHGEYLGEHGQFGHQELYEEMLHVPMMVRSPTESPDRRSDQVSTVDLAPTLLGLLGLPRLEKAEGFDLLDASRPPPPSHYLIAEWRNHAPFLGEREVQPKDFLISVQSSSVKFIYDMIFPRKSQLFDRIVDPGESENVFTDEAALQPGIRKALEEHLTQMTPEAQSVAGVAFDEDT
ncbi:MAG: sulfatase, partial [bacterium]|nr:sulfatase [bacterium]